MEDKLIDEHDPENLEELHSTLEDLLVPLQPQSLRSINRETFRKILEDEIEAQFPEDKDLAMPSGGAQVVSHLTSIFPHKTSTDPSIILTPTTPVRDCYSFKGVYGNLTIRFPVEARLTGGEVQHNVVELAPLHSASASPKTVDFLGLTLNGNNDVVRVEPLGRLRRPPTRRIQRIKFFSRQSFNAVRISFIENHGEAVYTCIHGLRIFG